MGYPTTLTPANAPTPINLDSRAANGPDAKQVREQLERILASPLFTSSKRYPGLLRYVVEHALDNPSCELKERTIGIEVFGREPSYDTNHDPVVRTSAVEVRKRLLQYYQEPSHINELRIELVVGSYVPRFHFAAEPPTSQPLVAVIPRAPEVPTRNITWTRGIAWKTAAVGALLLITAAVIWLGPWHTASAADLFWEPLWDTKDPVLIGLSGGPQQNPPDAALKADSPTLNQLFRARSEYVAMGDAAAMAHILANLKSRGKPFTLVYDSTIQLTELKNGPAILIGPVNRWINLMAKDMRFTIERDEPVTRSWVSDRQHPERRDWSIQINAPASSIAEAYAVVSRVWNPVTGKFMVSISGLSAYATSAAGEFISDPKQMDGLMKTAPSGWNRKNIQIVIAATRVGTNVGSPRAVATYFW
jgi:hypothetical protein